MVTKDKAPTQPDKSQELKDKAISTKMDAEIDRLLSPKKTETTQAKVEPAPTAKTYSQEDYDKAVNEGNMWKGRVKETESIQKELTNLKAQLEDITAEREKLKIQIDELSQDDPDKMSLVKKDRQLSDMERQLKADRKAHDEEWAGKQETMKLADDTLREIAIFEIASTYEGGDPEKLKSLCDIAVANTDDQYRKIAETLWAKATPTTPTVPAMTIDSGKTAGDTSKISRQSLAAYSPQGKTGKDFANDQNEILDKFFGKPK